MSNILEFTEKPSLFRAYFNVFTGGRQAFSGLDSIPKLEAHRKNAKEDLQKIQEYREACGIGNDGKLPVFYPHILSSAMHIHMLADKRFPASALGAVHARNHILQHRAIAEDESVDLRCYFSDARVLKAGLEVDVATTVHVDGACVWESVSAYLFRGRKFGEAGENHPWAEFAELGAPEIEANWHVPGNMGRRYAKITGDYNPIHVSRILAKAFGFKRDIIHGMWSLARCMSHLQDLCFDRPIRVDVAFKGPVFIDSDTTLKAHAIDGGYRVDLYCQSNPRPCIVSVFKEAAESDSLLETKE